MFVGRCLLITGGTGSFGNAVLRRFLDSGLREIRILSRDEKKQDDHAPTVRQRPSSSSTSATCATATASAAPCAASISCFTLPRSSRFRRASSTRWRRCKTNVIGTDNVHRRRHRVRRAAGRLPEHRQGGLSDQCDGHLEGDDGEGHGRQVARRSKATGTVVCGTRYGNVMASRGSVIPLFVEQLRAEPAAHRHRPAHDALHDDARRCGRPGALCVRARFKRRHLRAEGAGGHDRGAGAGNLRAGGARRITRSRSSGHGTARSSTRSLLSREEMASAEDRGDYFRVPPDLQGPELREVRRSRGDAHLAGARTTTRTTRIGWMSAGDEGAADEARFHARVPRRARPGSGGVTCESWSPGRTGSSAATLVAALAPRGAMSRSFPLPAPRSPAELRDAVAGADAVVHLAGTNRPPDEREFMPGNAGSRTGCLRGDPSLGRRIPLLLSSSSQAEPRQPLRREQARRRGPCLHAAPRRSAARSPCTDCPGCSESGRGRTTTRWSPRSATTRFTASLSPYTIAAAELRTRLHRRRRDGLHPTPRWRLAGGWTGRGFAGLPDDGGRSGPARWRLPRDAGHVDDRACRHRAGPGAVFDLHQLPAARAVLLPRAEVRRPARPVRRGAEDARLRAVLVLHRASRRDARQPLPPQQDREVRRAARAGRASAFATSSMAAASSWWSMARSRRSSRRCLAGRTTSPTSATLIWSSCCGPTKCSIASDPIPTLARYDHEESSR